MAIRHFKKRVSPGSTREAGEFSSSSSSSSNEDSDSFSDQSDKETLKPDVSNRETVNTEAGRIKPTEQKTEIQAPVGYAAGSNGDESDGNANSESDDDDDDDDDDNDDNDDDNDSSSSDEEVTFHKPVFLKREKTGKPAVGPPSDEMRKQATIKRIQHEHSVLAKSESASRPGGNYSTDKELLKQIAQLDDTDNLDPEKERQAWLQRQDSRKARVREQLLQKQLELEEYEGNKLANEAEPQDLIASKHGLQFQPQNRIKRHKPAAPATASKKKTGGAFYQDEQFTLARRDEAPVQQTAAGLSSKAFRPQKVGQDAITFKDVAGNGGVLNDNDNDDTEYAVI